MLLILAVSMVAYLLLLEDKEQTDQLKIIQTIFQNLVGRTSLFIAFLIMQAKFYKSYFVEQDNVSSRSSPIHWDLHVVWVIALELIELLYSIFTSSSCFSKM